MPIYVYRCGSCQEYTEALQKASDAPLTLCPHCQSEALNRVIAPVGVIFKGSGFHKNDYSGKSSSASGESANKGESKPAESSPAAASTGGGETATSSPAPSSSSSGSSGGGTSA